MVAVLSRFSGWGDPGKIDCPPPTFLGKVRLDEKKMASDVKIYSMSILRDLKDTKLFITESKSILLVCSF